MGKLKPGGFSAESIIAEGAPFMVGRQSRVEKHPSRLTIGPQGLSHLLPKALKTGNQSGRLRAGRQAILPGADAGVPETPLPNQPDAGYMNERLLKHGLICSLEP